MTVLDEVADAGLYTAGAAADAFAITEEDDRD